MTGTRIVIVAAATAVLLLGAWAASGILFLVFGAVLIASLLSGAADWLSERTPLTRGLALAAVIMSVLAAMSAAGSLLMPHIVAQARELLKELPDAFAEFTARLNATAWGARVVDELHRLENVTRHGDMLGAVTGVFSTTLGAVASAFLLLVLTIYLASQPQLYRSGLLQLFVPERRERLGEVFDEIGVTLRHWFFGKLILMCFVAVATSIALSLLGMPLAFTLGLIAGLFDFIPNFGPPVAAIPALLIAFVQSPMTAAWVAVIYLAVQVSENHVLTPLVQRRAVDLPPALTIFSQALMAALFGLVGVIFATPLAAAARIAVKRLYVEDHLERK
jgi:predicted PurR-regulated permease PerM